MTVFASDAFTDSNGTLLQNHTPTVGGLWTKLVGGTGADIEIHNNQATPSGDGVVYYNGGTPSGAEYDVLLTQKIAGSSNYALGQYGRLSTSAETGYLAWSNAGAYFLYKAVSGSFTELGSWTTAPAANDVVKLEIRNASKKVFVNGTQRISSTNNDVTAAGKAGLRCYGTSTTFYVDDFSADDLSSGVTYVRPTILVSRAAVTRASRW